MVVVTFSDSFITNYNMAMLLLGTVGMFVLLYIFFRRKK